MTKSGWITVVFLALLIFAALTAHAGAALVLKDIDAIPTDSVTIATDTTNDKIAYKEVSASGIDQEAQPDDQIWLFDVKALVAALVSCTAKGEYADAWSDHASIADSGLVVFHSWAGNLDTSAPSCANVFLVDMDTSDITMIRDHALSPSISADGRYVVYEYNSNPEKGLPAIYRYDTKTSEELFIDYTSLGNTKGGWYFPNPEISDDGLTILYHTTKSGKPEVWQWTDGRKSTKIRDGTL